MGNPEDLTPVKDLRTRTPLDELRAEVTTLSDNPLLPAGIRSTLRRAVTVLLDQEQRIKALEVARHG